jgi:hypothetical protein
MKTLPASLIVVTLPLLVLAAPAPDTEAAKGTPADFDVHSGHFEKTDSGLKGDASYLVFTDREAFDEVFSVAATMKKQKFVPKDAFEKKMVVAVIKRGSAPFEYKVDKVTTDDGTLYIEYTTKMGPLSRATFRSPLLVSVAKNKYQSIVFIENGKKAETVKVGK